MIKERMRLDRYLCLDGERTRKEAAELIRQGKVSVNGVSAKDGKMKVEDGDTVLLCGRELHQESDHYYLMNKPAGVLTAARDAHAQTIMDLLPPAFLKMNVQPVGRLDKDSTGLLLLTNNGAAAHALLSPKNHVWKRYVVRVEGCLTEDLIPVFHEGMDLGDFVTQSAVLEILSSGERESRAAVMIREGKYHQVKRMMAHVGHEVISLHRESFGSLKLPEDLLPGQYRELTKEELQTLLQEIPSLSAAK